MQHFYTVMNDHEDIIFQDPYLAIMKDYLDAAYQGCACRKSQNENKAFEIYKILNLKVNPDVILKLKSALNANKLLFFHDNKHLYTF